MNASQRRRMLLVLALTAASGLATCLVALALQRNVAYLYTPSEVLRGEAGQMRFRLGGMVAKGSLQREPGSLVTWFTVTDGDAQLRVRSEQVLPDLFREGQGVIVTGQRKDDYFVGTEVLAKHDETYMPQEVASKMGKAHQKHAVQAPSTPGTLAEGTPP
ncbi:cytochrome c maturation protein CcmE [Stenotrophomonas sp. B1-1]|uniref:cytochrome c maturation protein CcmE n=1 Tax=Stenotrophomonas sp. B1-1 TaxID=2710648 RepID=UPI0013DAF2E9|nr:cytochrome c maturation protein CcmE [Stenotrophomonas sp. B1-1]